MKSGFYLYVYSFLLTPHGNFYVQTHTHTKQKKNAMQKQNKQTNTPLPPEKKTISCFD